MVLKEFLTLVAIGTIVWSRLSSAQGPVPGSLAPEPGPVVPASCAVALGELVCIERKGEMRRAIPLPGESSDEEDDGKRHVIRKLSIQVALQVPMMPGTFAFAEKHIPPVEVYHRLPALEYVDEVGCSSIATLLGARAKCKAKISAKEPDAVTRKRLLESWMKILLLDPSQTRVGMQLRRASSNDDRAVILQYTFSGRANAILSARLQPVLSYLLWSAQCDASWTPVEDDLFKYMSQENSRHHALSRAESTVESFKFVLFVCRGIVSLKETRESPLRNGMAREHTLLTGNRKQSMELERKVMVRLETLIFHMALDETRFVIAGAALFQGYFRARFADGGYTLVFMEEKHFYLMEVSQTKISHLDTGRLPKYMLAPRVSSQD